MSSYQTGVAFYPADWGEKGPPPCDLNLANARYWLLKILESMHAGQAGDCEDVVRYIDKLIEAHVQRYAYKNPISHNSF